VPLHIQQSRQKQCFNNFSVTRVALSACLLGMCVFGAIAGDEPPSGKPEPVPAAKVMPIAKRIGYSSTPPTATQRAQLGKDRNSPQLLPAKFIRYASRIIQNHDLNDSGQLENAEWLKMKGQPKLADLDADGIITLAELARRIAYFGKNRNIRLVAPPVSIITALGFSGANSPAANPADPASPIANTLSPPPPMVPSAEDNEKKPLRQPTRFYVDRSKLPAGIPDWFFARDKDGDAQLTLAEFSPTARQSELKQFAEYDRNRDHIVTAKELVQASKKATPTPKPATAK